MYQMPGKNENKASMKGEARASGGAGRGSIKSMEKIGSSQKGGIRFGCFGDHPDKSRVRGPEHK